MSVRPRSYYLERLRRIVRRCGGEVRSASYVNNATKLRYRCGEGHEWEAVPASITMGRWCPVCAWRLREPFQAKRRQAASRRLTQLVERRGGVILPPGFVGFAHPMRVQCARRHTWDARADSVDFPGRAEPDSRAPSNAYTVPRSVPM